MISISNTSTFEPPAGAEPNLLQRAASLYSKVTLQQPFVPGQPTGPLLSTLAKGALGAGIGYGAGTLMGGYDKDKTRRSLALAGGLVGLGTGVPSMLLQAQDYPNHPYAAQLAPFPIYQKQGSLASYEDQAPLQPGDLGSEMAPTPYGGVSPWLSGDPVSVSQATGAILSDVHLGPVARVQALQAVGQAAARDQGRPWLTTGDLARGALGAGMGLGAGLAFGKVLGAVAGMPSETQTGLGRIGALAGLLKAFGVW